MTLCENNLGRIYKYINSQITYRPQIGALTDTNGNAVTEDEAKANIFNKYFASVGVAGNGILPKLTSLCIRKEIDAVAFDEAKIMAAIDRLQPNLSAGPDGLLPILLKN